MRVVVNCSNLVIGGGIQVAISFLNEIRSHKENRYLIFLSKQVEEQIKRNSFSDNFEFKTIAFSPSRIRTRATIANILDEECLRFNPDIVISVFGPSYWKPKSVPHLCGFADGWCYNEDSITYSQLGFLARVKRLLLNRYKGVWLKKTAQYFFLETEVAKTRFASRYSIPMDNISVVSNTYQSFYNNLGSSSTMKEEETFRLVMIAAFYPNKNHKIIKDVVKCLRGRLNFEFTVTLPKQIYSRIYGSDFPEIVNIGPIPSKKCPEIYATSDAMFLPTLLETFSANYPEAMIMRKPILTSDLDFAHDICQDAALYFDPLDAKDIAEKIMKLASDNNLYRELQIKGLRRVKDFPSAVERAKLILNICEKIVKQNNNV